MFFSLWNLASSGLMIISFFLLQIKIGQTSEWYHLHDFQLKLCIFNYNKQTEIGVVLEQFEESLILSMLT